MTKWVIIDVVVVRERSPWCSYPGAEAASIYAMVEVAGK